MLSSCEQHPTLSFFFFKLSSCLRTAIALSSSRFVFLYQHQQFCSFGELFFLLENNCRLRAYKPRHLHNAMADLEGSTIVVQDDLPLAQRHKRRSSTLKSPIAVTKSSIRNASHGISTPPTTPQPQKKKVRFSDPGPNLSYDNEDDVASGGGETGLTPFISRTALDTPSSRAKGRGKGKGKGKGKTQRRQSIPAKLWNLNKQPDDEVLQFAPLRQVLDGRVKRRIARSGLSEEVNALEGEKRKRGMRQREQVRMLRKEVEEKDKEVQEMREELEVRSQIEGESGGSGSRDGDVMLIMKVDELEKEVEGLRERLGEKSQESEMEGERSFDWTMAARDPFDAQSDDGHDRMITDFDDNDAFGDMNVDEMDTTPSSLRTTIDHVNTSFDASMLSPPATLPNTPCKPSRLVSEGAQASLTIQDPENEELKQQLDELKSEASKLTSAIALDEDMKHRLITKLSEHLPATADSSSQPDPQTLLDLALDNVLTTLTLTQNAADEANTRFTALTTEIRALGFPTDSSNPSSTLASIATHFRTARLELETLLPGETTEGFAPDKLLTLLLSRIKTLLQQVRDRDGEIDAYHEQEISLRQQLSTRVDALDEVKRRLADMQDVIEGLRDEVEEKEKGHESMTRALEGYRKEVAGLEKVIHELDHDGRAMKEKIKANEDELVSETLRCEVMEAEQEGQTLLINELHKRLAAALDASTRLSNELDELRQQHGEDATLLSEKTEVMKSYAETISSLTAKLEETTSSLRDARTIVEELQKQNIELEAQIEGEKKLGRLVVSDMKRNLMTAMEVGEGYLIGAVSVRDPFSEGERVASEKHQAIDVGNMGKGKIGVGYLSGDLARRGSKKRRRYDSGLGFLEEEDEDDLTGRLGGGVAR